MTRPPAVVIVDGYTDTGMLLASRFRARGITCIAVISGAGGDRPAGSGPAEGASRGSLYHDTITENGDPAAVIQALDGWTVLGVIPGSADAIVLADTLSERMNLCTNGTRRSQARQDRFEMQQTLIDAGVPTKAFIRTSDEMDLLAWYRSRGFGKIVIKPVNHSPGRPVTVCGSEQEVVDAFRALKKIPEGDGEADTGVLAEEYLAGTEYCVDTVSVDGTHRLAGITAVRTKECTPTSDENTIPQDKPYDDHTEVVRYTISTLDALRIRYGAARTQIMMTKKGPLLIDTAAWMSGGGIPHGHDTISRRKAEMMVDAYCNPAGFVRPQVPRIPDPETPAGQMKKE